MVKTALITNYWKNSDGGGIKTYFMNLVEVLQNKGVDVRMLFWDGDDPKHFCGGKNNVAFSLTCYCQLQKIRPDLIHSQGTWYCLLPGILYKKLHGCTLLYSFHTEPDKALPLPVRVFFQSLLNAYSCVTFISKGLQKRVYEADGFSFPKTAITYVCMKIKKRLKEMRLSREAFQLNHATPVLPVQAFIANTLKIQGIKKVIQTLKLLKGIYHNVILLATQEGDCSYKLKAFVKAEGVGDLIIYIGDEQKPSVPISICNTFIFPWLWKKGVGLALFQGGACRKPIIGMVVGCGSKAIIDGKNGLLVVLEAEQVAAKIDLLLQDREYADRLGKCVKKSVEERFTWE